MGMVAAYCSAAAGAMAQGQGAPAGTGGPATGAPCSRCVRRRAQRLRSGLQGNAAAQFQGRYQTRQSAGQGQQLQQRYQTRQSAGQGQQLQQRYQYRQSAGQGYQARSRTKGQRGSCPLRIGP